MKYLYSYKDIVLSPSISSLRSRRLAYCKPCFLGKTFNSVAIPANMSDIISYELAEKLSELGYFYILHRFYPREDILHWLSINQKLQTISISVGIKPEDYEFIDKVVKYNLKVHFITIDVAHGHHTAVQDLIGFIKHKLPNTKIIAGNVGTKKAVEDLSSWGAHAAKVGLSMGKSCTTYNCTGVGTPMFSTVLNICGGDGFINQNPIPIIADGQVREVGDICKALVAGADLVMIGSEFAKCTDSPAVWIDESRNYKWFHGSASEKVKGGSDFIEGAKVLLPARKETYTEFLNRIQDGVQSCISYSGGDSLFDLKSMEYSVHY